MKVNDNNAWIDNVNNSVRMKVSTVVSKSISVEFRRVVCRLYCFWRLVVLLLLLVVLLLLLFVVDEEVEGELVVVVCFIGLLISGGREE